MRRRAGSAVYQLVARRAVVMKIHPPDQAARPASATGAVCLGRDGRSVTMHARGGIEPVVFIEESPPSRSDRARRRSPGQPSRIRIESRTAVVHHEVMLVRFTRIESRPFELDGIQAETQRDDAETPVRRVLPVMAEWCHGIVSGRLPVHERHRPERRLPHRAAID